MQGVPLAPSEAGANPAHTMTSANGPCRGVFWPEKDPMKVLLIYPPCLEERVSGEDAGVVPIGLYYIGALLRESGVEVEILNASGTKLSPGEVRAVFEDRQPDILGFSIVNANRWGGLEMARAAKHWKPEVPVVFGGVTPTFLWEHFLTHFSQVDFVVTGEGEHPFLHLVRHIGDPGSCRLESHGGIAFRKGGKPFHTGKSDPIVDLDTLPQPARHFTYRHVTSSRGCRGSCTFCGSPRFWGRTVRFHSAQYFVDQLELLHARGVDFFYVSDDTFTADKARVVEICRQILARGLEICWAAISRVDCVDEETLYWMRRAGCIQISYGVESGSPRIRRHLGKSMADGQIKEAFRLTGRFGILPRAYFIYGSPGETRGTIEQSAALIKEIRPLGAVFYILSLFPGTALYSRFKKQHGVTDDIWLQPVEDIMYFQTDPTLSEEKVLSFGKTLRERFYAGLPEAVDRLELVDRQELYGAHCDFCSRLGMTFSLGDYAREQIPAKEAVAEKLFRMSLEYSANKRAYLGLGIVHQKRSSFADSISILTEGIRHFPQDEELHTCLGMSHMHAGQLHAALDHLLPFGSSRQALRCIADCYRALGDKDKERSYRAKLGKLG